MGSIIAALPELADENSMLSRRFGREVANYFSGSPLNRFSFLRTDHVFLTSAFGHPTARFMLLDNLSPLVTQDKPPRLAFVTAAEVTPLTGTQPFIKTEAELVRDFNSEEIKPLVLFLGIDEKQGLATEGSDFQYKSYKGSPFFAVDVTPRGSLADVAKQIVEGAKEKGFTLFTGPRNMSLKASEGNGTCGRSSLPVSSIQSR